MAGNVLTATIKIDDSNVKQAFDNTASSAAKAKNSLQDTDKVVAEIVSSAKNLDDALDKLSRQGLVSVNSLEEAMKGFKQAFGNATDPNDIKKFGEAITVLQKRQSELIASGLGLEKQHASTTVSTQRLSSSLLGMSKIFDILPDELQHTTHGFDQILQSFERITHGTEGAGEKVLKFAGVLGEVGLGIAISIAIGLLADLGKELFTTGDAFSSAEIDAAKFKSELEDVDNQIKLLGKNTELATQIAKLRAQIKLGSGTEANIVGDKAEIENNVNLIEKINFQIDDLIEKFGALTRAAPFQKLGVQAKQLLDESSLVAGVPELFPKDLVSKLKGRDKEFIEEIESTNKLIHDLNVQREDIQNKNRLTELQIELERSKDGKKNNKEYANLLKERQQILEEFTAKFATIKLPLPILDTQLKNIKVTPVNNKLLRDFLQGTLSVFDKEFKNLSTGAIDPKTLPVEIKFAPLFINITDTVRNIQDKFGDISKEVQNAVNKGLFNIPIDFISPPEGDGKALAVSEKRFLDLARQIENFTGQQRVILSFNFDTSKLNDKDLRDITEDLKRFQEARSALFGLGNFDLSKVFSTESVQNGLAGIFKSLNGIKGQIETIEQFKSFEHLSQQIQKAAELTTTVLTPAFEKFFDGVVNGEIKIKNFFEGLIDIIKQIIVKLLTAAAVSAVLAAVTGGSFTSIFSGLIGFREKGGPVGKDKKYIVNEKGTEIFQTNKGNQYLIPGGKQLFTPPVSGKIINHFETEKILKNSTVKDFNTKSITNKISGYRSAGGGVVAGNTYVVNEMGREIFVPSTGGRINTAQPSGSINNSGISVNIGGQIMIAGKDLIAVLANAGRSQGRLT